MALIRPEKRADFDAIHRLLRITFGREGEARLVDRLRASGKMTAALVAQDNEYLLGHVVFSRIVIDAPAGAVGALALASLAVLPAFQRLGIGSALVSAGLEECRAQHHPRVLVLGDAGFFVRFGFVPAGGFRINGPTRALDHSFAVIELDPGAFAGASGTARYGPEFEDLE